MHRTRNFNGGIDPDSPDTPVVMAPLLAAKPAPLMYFVTARKSMKPIYGPADVTTCVSWTREEAVTRAAPLEIREVSTGVVFFSFNARGRFG